jgi:hypothetical protein
LRREGFQWPEERHFGWEFKYEHFGPLKVTEVHHLAPPEFTITARREVEGGDREIEGVLRAGRGSPFVGIILPLDRVGPASIQGAPVPEQGRPADALWRIRITTMPPDGVHVVVRIRGAAPVDAVLVEETAGLPADGSRFVDLLPPWATPAADGNLTVVAAHQDW